VFARAHSPGSLLSHPRVVKPRHLVILPVPTPALFPGDTRVSWMNTDYDLSLTAAQFLQDSTHQRDVERARISWRRASTTGPVVLIRSRPHAKTTSTAVLSPRVSSARDYKPSFQACASTKHNTTLPPSIWEHASQSLCCHTHGIA
jgi:hypothetical protein